MGGTAVAVQSTTVQDVNAWAQTYVSRVRERVADARVVTDGAGNDRDWLYNVSLDRPTEIVPTFLTNVVESITGTRDERAGRALNSVLLAGYQFAQAGLNAAARGSGVLATGSSVLGKLLPTLGVASGVAQVWRGWNELDNHDAGALSILGSRTGRSGLLNVVASALGFVPGFGTAIGGALTRLTVAANEMDAFSFLDAPTHAT